MFLCINYIDKNNILIHIMPVYEQKRPCQPLLFNEL